MTRGFASYESRRFVTDLMAYMTLEEKLGQLDLFHAADDPGLEEALVAGRVGGILGGVHSHRWQTLATERSRLGIPLLLTADWPGSALSPWAVAASWDCSLAETLGASAARHALESGCNAVAAPGVGSGSGSEVFARQIAASEAHLAAHMARGFCLGAAPQQSGSDDDVLCVVRLKGPDAPVDQATAFEFAHLGVNAAIDCNGLGLLQAERAGFSGILVGECARIREQVARQFAGSRVKSRLEAAEAALVTGLLSEGELDAAVRGVLTAKHAIGLFREPHRRLTAGTGTEYFDRPADRARATMVLLRNEAGLLPLSPVSDRVLVVGATDGAAAACSDALSRTGIANTAAPGLAVRRLGESWTQPVTGDHFALALTRDAAKRADFLLVVLEDRHFTRKPEGGWPVPGAAAIAMLRALAPVGPRLVGLIATSEPVDLADADEHFAAVLQCWAPGPGFEEALGDILSGREGPVGRMPVAAGRFAFGHGLAFSETVFSQFKVSPGDGCVAASLIVRNAGSFSARETVQVYVRDEGGGLRLAAFSSLDLAAGAEEEVRFSLGLDALGSRGDSGRRELAPGALEILVGKDQRRLLSATVEISQALARTIVNRDSGQLRLAS